jgi:hypothetical protein
MEQRASMDETTGDSSQRPALSSPDSIVNAVVSTTEMLSDAELAALYLAVATQLNPTSEPWYPRVAHLFTEADGTRMHADVKAVLDRVIQKRLGD